jgi:hypothetical protein
VWFLTLFIHFSLLPVQSGGLETSTRTKVLALITALLSSGVSEISHRLVGIVLNAALLIPELSEGAAYKEAELLSLLDAYYHLLFVLTHRHGSAVVPCVHVFIGACRLLLFR